MKQQRRKIKEMSKPSVTLACFALSSADQFIDGGSEAFGLLLAGEVETDLTGLKKKKTECLSSSWVCGSVCVSYRRAAV